MKLKEIMLGVTVLLMFVLAVGGAGWAQKGKPPQPPPPPANPAIAFIGSGGLMVMNDDGSNQKIVVPAARGDYLYSPSWSPDGTQLVFAGLLKGERGIWIVTRDGSGLRKVATLFAGSGYPAWSPAPTADGNYKIAFSDTLPGREDIDLFVVNVDGSGLVNLTDSVGPGETDPNWNSTATRLVVKYFADVLVTDEDIVVLDLGLENGNLKVVGATNLTETGPLADAQLAHPDWARTQDLIALTAFGDGGGDIWIIDLLDPANPTRVTATTTVDERMPSWSPADSHMAFIRKNARNKQTIFKMTSYGTDIRELGPDGASYPSWRRNP